MRDFLIQCGVYVCQWTFCCQGRYGREGCFWPPKYGCGCLLDQPEHHGNILPVLKAYTSNNYAINEEQIRFVLNKYKKVQSHVQLETEVKNKTTKISQINHSIEKNRTSIEPHQTNFLSCKGWVSSASYAADILGGEKERGWSNIQ